MGYITKYAQMGNSITKSHDMNERLNKMIKNDDFINFKRLIDSGKVNINGKIIDDGITLLQKALLLYKYNIAELLLDNDDIIIDDDINNAGKTTLMCLFDGIEKKMVDGRYDTPDMIRLRSRYTEDNDSVNMQYYNALQQNEMLQITILRIARKIIKKSQNIVHDLHIFTRLIKMRSYSNPSEHFFLTKTHIKLIKMMLKRTDSIGLPTININHEVPIVTETIIELSPLSYAIFFKSNTDIVSYLIKKGSSVRKTINELFELHLSNQINNKNFNEEVFIKSTFAIIAASTGHIYPTSYGYQYSILHNFRQEVKDLNTIIINTLPQPIAEELIENIYDIHVKYVIDNDK